jgi:hypothetical protein
VSRRYSQTQFLKDAAWIGLPPDASFSRAELRRRRDRLMSVHHPDRGGDAEKAARINATYARMVDWLDSRSAKEVERKGSEASFATDRAETDVYKSSLAAAFHAGAAYFAAAALVAFATYAAFRGNKKP